MLRVWYSHEAAPHHHKIYALNITGYHWGWQPVQRNSTWNRRPITFRAHLAMFVLDDVRTANGTLAVPAYVSLINTECETPSNALRVIYNKKKG